jgi:hypothetical protein
LNKRDAGGGGEAISYGAPRRRDGVDGAGAGDAGDDAGGDVGGDVGGEAGGDSSGDSSEDLEAAWERMQRSLAEGRAHRLGVQYSSTVQPPG